MPPKANGAEAHRSGLIEGNSSADISSTARRGGVQAREGERNVCCRVLLDRVMAKTRKVGYYLCKSMRVPEPRGGNKLHHTELRAGLGARVIKELQITIQFNFNKYTHCFLMMSSDYDVLLSNQLFQIPKIRSIYSERKPHFHQTSQFTNGL